MEMAYRLSHAQDDGWCPCRWELKRRSRLPSEGPLFCL